MSKPIDLAKIQRILVTRTDRIGDVVLSTPVIESLRNRFPMATLAFMVTPETRQLVEGNPFLDFVIVYDKKGSEKSWRGTWDFASRLREHRFDIAIHLHPTNRVHWVSFLARIPIRLGWRAKNHRLLTHVIPHVKPEGIKHEAEYNFDLLKALEIEVPQTMNLHVPLREEVCEELERIKESAGLAGSSFIAVAPGASCPSKMWAPSRFAELADRLTEKYQAPVVLIGATRETALSERIIGWTQSAPVNLVGRLSLSQTAWLLNQADLLISNDSGPVHIATAVGTPVIALFGRKQPGLSPRRWGPLSSSATVIHKDVGCVSCRAHLCPYSFLCLDAISVEEVLEATQKLNPVKPCKSQSHSGGKNEMSANAGEAVITEGRV